MNGYSDTQMIIVKQHQAELRGEADAERRRAIARRATAPRTDGGRVGLRRWAFLPQPGTPVAATRTLLRPER
jgi:hypothetical protein